MMQNHRSQMVEQQVRAWEVLDPAVLDAMQTIPREEFLPEKFKKVAHSDVAFNLHNGFVLPCPSVQGKTLQALQLEDDDAILQIGLGCGYLSACLAFLGGHVTVTEADEQISDHAQDLFQKMSIKNISVQNTSWEEALKVSEKKYTAIASQFAFKQVPVSLKKALKLNGRAVLFVGSTPVISCIVIERIGENEWLSEDIFETEVSPFPQKSITGFTF